MPPTHVPLASARWAAARRWDRKSKLAIGAAVLLLVIVLLGWDSLEPAAAPLFGGHSVRSGVLGGLRIGRTQVHFLPIVGRGPQRSQSLGAVYYRSYDVLNHPFDLTDTGVEAVALRALQETPFLPASADTRPHGDWDGMWLFHTHDSNGRPVYLDERGILGMLRFTKAHEDSEALQDALRRVVRGPTMDDRRTR